EVLLRQHRNHYISIYIYRSHARLIRWDRTGAIVSESVDYVKNPLPLLTFAYRLTKMTPAQLGYDNTVVNATKEEIAEMRSILPTLVLQHHRDYLLHALSPGWPVYKMRVESEEGPRYYLVGRYRAGSRSPLGRGSRGYVAYDCSDKRLVFLKDAWRVDSSDVWSELQIYEVLKEHSVRYVPTIICGGDVEPMQHTTNDAYLTPQLIKLVRYRIVMKDIGRPLSEQRAPEEPLYAVYYAAAAHESAWMAGILHSDVSDRNILIYEDPEHPDAYPVQGLLIDWDLARPKGKLVTSSGAGRSGTWRFMSALSQKYPKKPYEVADDIESFIHVLALNALRFQTHDMSASHLLLCHHIQDVYDGYRDGENGYDIGEVRKYKLVSSGSLGFEITSSSSYQNILVKLLGLCKTYYDEVDHQSLQQYYVKPSTSGNPQKNVKQQRAPPMPPPSARRGRVAPSPTSQPTNEPSSRETPADQNSKSEESKKPQGQPGPPPPSLDHTGFLDTLEAMLFDKHLYLMRIFPKINSKVSSGCVRQVRLAGVPPARHRLVKVEQEVNGAQLMLALGMRLRVEASDPMPKVSLHLVWRWSRKKLERINLDLGPGLSVLDVDRYRSHILPLLDW
ncbi:hypothetical protein C8Q75DRAFT_830639, partial [Abortiporus biennis]